MPLDTSKLGLDSADMKGEGARPYPAVFIRAPAVLEVGVIPFGTEPIIFFIVLL